MSDIKCPVCQNKLHKINIIVSTCTNDKCKLWGSSIPNLVLEALAQAKQDLERTRKALDVAVSQLKKTRDYIEDCRYQETNYFLVDSKDVSIIFDETNESLKKITALEQKDK